MMKFFKRIQEQPAPTTRKVVVKNVVAKKAPVKKVARPKKAVAVVEKKICDAPDELCFWVNNGPVVKNVIELKDALNGMNDEQYGFHTSREGNDFARWLEDVLGEKSLAQKIAKLKSKDSAAKAIEKYLQ